MNTIILKTEKFVVVDEKCYHAYDPAQYDAALCPVDAGRGETSYGNPTRISRVFNGKSPDHTCNRCGRGIVSENSALGAELLALLNGKES